MIAQMTQKNGVRMSAARSFLRPAQNRPNLHILLNSTVTKVLIHPKTKTAHGVEFVDGYGHSMKILTKKEVIVAGGAINSPQILMLSGVGPKDELKKVEFLHKPRLVSLFIRFFPRRLASSPSLTCQALERISTTTLLTSQTSSSTTPTHPH